MLLHRLRHNPEKHKGSNIKEAIRTRNLLYILTPLLLAVILVFLLLIKILKFIYRWLSQGMKILKAILSAFGANSLPGGNAVDNAIGFTGFLYDPAQDIFYSDMNPWQREFGYCRLYDEASAPFGMILDCEPIYFEYGGKNWLIEFWKGQYDLTTGCEAGVYTAKEPVTNFCGTFNDTLYDSVNDADCLFIAYSLKKNGKTILTRKDKHWWVTGFKLGEFSQPSELSMNILITLKDEKMCNAFVKGLHNAGYPYEKIFRTDNSIRFRFNEPRTPQPYTRTKFTDWLIQKKNKYMCDRYRELTGPFGNIDDKLKALQEKAPGLYKKAAGIRMNGRAREKIRVFNSYLK